MGGLRGATAAPAAVVAVGAAADAAAAAAAAPPARETEPCRELPSPPIQPPAHSRGLLEMGQQQRRLMHNLL